MQISQTCFFQLFAIDAMQRSQRAPALAFAKHFQPLSQRFHVAERLVAACKLSMRVRYRGSQFVPAKQIVVIRFQRQQRLQNALIRLAQRAHPGKYRFGFRGNRPGWLIVLQEIIDHRPRREHCWRKKLNPSHAALSKQLRKQYAPGAPARQHAAHMPQITERGAGG